MVCESDGVKKHTTELIWFSKKKKHSFSISSSENFAEIRFFSKGDMLESLNVGEYTSSFVLRILMNWSSLENNSEIELFKWRARKWAI